MYQQFFVYLSKKTEANKIEEKKQNHNNIININTKKNKTKNTVFSFVYLKVFSNPSDPFEWHSPGGNKLFLISLVLVVLVEEKSTT